MLGNPFVETRLHTGGDATDCDGRTGWHGWAVSARGDALLYAADCGYFVCPQGIVEQRRPRLIDWTGGLGVRGPELELSGFVFKA